MSEPSEPVPEISVIDTCSEEDSDPESDPEEEEEEEEDMIVSFCESDPEAEDGARPPAPLQDFCVDRVICDNIDEW